MVSEAGHIVETFFTPGACNDVLGLQHFSFDLPHGSVIYADKRIPIMLWKMLSTMRGSLSNRFRKKT